MRTCAGAVKRAVARTWAGRRARIGAGTGALARVRSGYGGRPAALPVPVGGGIGFMGSPG
ncbi:hypothetical protein GCM10010345_31050 [Streptomyces canarius]|uniref:Uncharacterized protein n=1 Tax=Streptomyces canarius TaxID=285453 RepID=A0ABQ3CLU5_9ACTN|nr:hypothetical protein GCM10010345_31050 [Streptomyces canarius]